MALKHMNPASAGAIFLVSTIRAGVEGCAPKELFWPSYENPAFRLSFEKSSVIIPKEA